MPPLTIWGSCHRSDTAEKHASAEVPMVGRLMDLAYTLNRLFGVNAGATLLRGVASELGKVFMECRDVLVPDLPGEGC